LLIIIISEALPFFKEEFDLDNSLSFQSIPSNQGFLFSGTCLIRPKVVRFCFVNEIFLLEFFESQVPEKSLKIRLLKREISHYKKFSLYQSLRQALKSPLLTVLFKTMSCDIHKG